jgi:hypothetical protein
VRAEWERLRCHLALSLLAGKRNNCKHQLWTGGNSHDSDSRFS